MNQSVSMNNTTCRSSPGVRANLYNKKSKQTNTRLEIIYIYININIKIIPKSTRQAIKL